MTIQSARNAERCGAHEFADCVMEERGMSVQRMGDQLKKTAASLCLEKTRLPISWGPPDCLGFICGMYHFLRSIACSFHSNCCRISFLRKPYRGMSWYCFELRPRVNASATSSSLLVLACLKNGTSTCLSKSLAPSGVIIKSQYDHQSTYIICLIVRDA